MTHPGATWKARREAMGKSLDDAASALRVSRRFLRGIEEGNYGGFPERVFSTGFIRSYAKFLSVDPGPVLVEYEKTAELQPDDEVLAQLAPEWLERERERGSRKTTYIVAAGAVLLLGIVLAWFSMRMPEPPGVSRPVVEPPAATSQATPAPSAENAAPPVRVEDNAAPASAVADNAAATIVSTSGGSGPLTGPFQLFLEASEHTWLMYSFDGGDPIDVTLYAGDKISIQAERQISLKIGNAAGIVGTLNGQRLPPFGERGQVRKITFGQ